MLLIELLLGCSQYYFLRIENQMKWQVYFNLNVQTFAKH